MVVLRAVTSPQSVRVAYRECRIMTYTPYGYGPWISTHHFHTHHFGTCSTHHFGTFTNTTIWMHTILLLHIYTIYVWILLSTGTGLSSILVLAIYRCMNRVYTMVILRVSYLYCGRSTQWEHTPLPSTIMETYPDHGPEYVPYSRYMSRYIRVLCIVASASGCMCLSPAGGNTI